MELEMVGWHHQLNEREFEQTPGDGEGQRSLVCRSPWGSQRVGHKALPSICAGSTSPDMEG